MQKTAINNGFDIIDGIVKKRQFYRTTQTYPQKQGEVILFTANQHQTIIIIKDSSEQRQGIMFGQQQDNLMHRMITYFSDRPQPID